MTRHSRADQIAAQWWACGRKRRYESREDAATPGQAVYRCEYCGGWHRASKRRKR